VAQVSGESPQLGWGSACGVRPAPPWIARAEAGARSAFQHAGVLAIPQLAGLGPIQRALDPAAQLGSLSRAFWRHIYGNALTI